MSKKQKYYVVWKGKKTGVFLSWKDCKEQVVNFKGSQYKAFTSKKEADLAFSKSYNDYKGVNTQKKELSPDEKRKYGNPVTKSISVDAACSGNPGSMEYRGVLTNSGKEVFAQGPFLRGTNNVGEFLALVHALALLKKKKLPELPVYSDSQTAISWVRKKNCKTKLIFNEKNEKLKNLIVRAENWLKENTFQNPILKWETKAWGEIPADFGRKK